MRQKVVGPPRAEDGSWSVRKNSEIEQLVAEPNIIEKYLKAQRLYWLVTLNGWKMIETSRKHIRVDRSDAVIFIYLNIGAATEWRLTCANFKPATTEESRTVQKMRRKKIDVHSCY